MQNSRTPQIAIVDLSKDAQNICSQIKEACETSGCFYIKNHGIPEEIIQNAFTQMNRFFALPVEIKQKCIEDNRFGRGYTSFKSQNVGELMGRKGEPNDPLEKFAMGNMDPFPSDEEKLLDDKYKSQWCPNVWPDQDLPEYRVALESYYRNCQGLAKRILSFFAIILQLPEDTFVKELSLASHSLKCNYYPALERGTHQIRIAEHTDLVPLTILAQDESKGGLRVRLKSGEWVDGDPIPGTLFINIGDLMSRWTNDIWVATVHKVIVPEKKEGEAQVIPARSSIAFFVVLNPESIISCIPSCREASGGVDKYPPIHYSDWLSERLQRMNHPPY